MRFVDTDGAETLRWAVLLVIALGAMYFAVSPKDLVSADPLTNTLTAWSVGTRGSFLLPEFQQFVEPGPEGTVMHLVETQAGPVSQYPPGAAMLAAPIYGLVGTDLTHAYIGAQGSVRFRAPPVWPAALTAAASTGLGVALVFLAMATISDRKTALVAALVLALGTGCFSVASQALWQHGPAVLWIALGMLGTSWAGRSGSLAWIPAALTRPHTVLIGGTTVLYSAWAKRRPRLLIPLVGPVLGILILSLFNYYIYGKFNLTGGYAETTIGQLPDPDLRRWLRNLVGALIDPTRGLLIYSPFLIVLLPGLRRGWRTAPDWARGAALGAVFYLLVQYTLNRFSGGDRFIGYRYPIEALVAASPLLVSSYAAWVRGHRVREIAFGIGVLAAVILQAVGVAFAGHI
jgi:hypothetical protein